MPWNGESGCNEMQRIFGLSSFNRRVVPTNVPLVPIMETKCVIVPPSVARFRWLCHGSELASWPSWNTGRRKNIFPVTARKSRAQRGWLRRSRPQIGINDIRSIGAQDALALHGNVFRHAQRDFKSFGGADHGKRNAGIAAGGVEQNFAGSEFSTAAPLGHNAGRGAVVDEFPGIDPFCFASSSTPGIWRAMRVRRTSGVVPTRSRLRTPNPWALPEACGIEEVALSKSGGTLGIRETMT